MLTIKGKALGRRRPLFADFSVPPPTDVVGQGDCTLRDLIECVVRHEVAAFRERQYERQFVRVVESLPMLAELVCAPPMEWSTVEQAYEEFDRRFRERRVWWRRV